MVIGILYTVTSSGKKNQSKYIDEKAGTIPSNYVDNDDSNDDDNNDTSRIDQLYQGNVILTFNKAIDRNVINLISNIVSTNINEFRALTRGVILENADWYWLQR